MRRFDQVLQDLTETSNKIKQLEVRRQRLSEELIKMYTDITNKMAHYASGEANPLSTG